MDIPLMIEVLLEQADQQRTINYFTADKWTPETELLLIQHLHELLQAIKSNTRSLNIHFTIKAADTVEGYDFLNALKPHWSGYPKGRLTTRESEILALIAQGFTNAEIAKKLFISFETVRSHRKKILSKRHAKNTASLIASQFEGF